jgi:DNA-binding MarR family transcriptional regulator
VTTADADAVAVPPRASWPDPPAATEGGQALTELVVTTFRLNGALMEAAQALSAHGDITPAWWQVLGGILDEPRTVAEIGRTMGVTRQGVLRIADLLVAKGLAEYRPNPAHRRAQLVACTEAGYWAIRRITLAQHPWTARIASGFEPGELVAATEVMRRLADILDADSSGDVDHGA